MIGYLETVVDRILGHLGGWLCGIPVALIFALAAMAFLGLNLYKFDRESYWMAFRRLGGLLARGWGWMLTLVVLLLQVYALSELRKGLNERLAEQGKARYVTGETASGLPTTQRAPQVSYLETTTRSQRIVVPSSVTTLDALPGWSPEQARYGERPAVNVQDELIKDDKSVVINRTLEVQRYVPMKLTNSTVEVKLGFPRGQVYQSDFVGRYTVRNPFDDARRIHFAFPLPDNSGTLSGFHFKVDGREVQPQDVARGLDWEMDMTPGQQAVVEVAYQHLGAKAWNYDLCGRREPIADFHLRVNVDQGDVKFLRGSLYPTQTSGRLLEWHLQNQITSQSICLYFPFIPSEQIAVNLFVFAPLASVVLAVLIVTWARLRQTGTSPWRTTLAGLAGCLGYTLASYLLGYLPLPAALLLAFAVTAGLQRMALGARLQVPVAAAAVAPLTFLLPGHTGLLLTSLGILVLTLTIRETIGEAPQADWA